jgi:hypothetical protein
MRGQSKEAGDKQRRMEGVRVSGRHEKEANRPATALILGSTNAKRRHRGIAMSVLMNEGAWIFLHSLYSLQWLLLLISCIIAIDEDKAGGKLHTWLKIRRVVVCSLVPSTCLVCEPRLLMWARQSASDALRWRRETLRAREGKVV